MTTTNQPSRASGNPRPILRPSTGLDHDTLVTRRLLGLWVALALLVLSGGILLECSGAGGADHTPTTTETR